MKKATKFLALLLALVLTMGLGVTAFAAGTNTITVRNAVSGQKYELYRILDLVVNDNKTAYSYTVNSAWANFFKNPDGKGLTYVNIDAQGYVTWKEGTDVAAFAKDAEEFAEDLTALNAITASSDGDITFNGLEAGYYLVTSTLGTKATVGTTPESPNAEIREKNQAPSNEKQVQEDSTGNYGSANDADIGQTVNFKSTITAQPGAENYVFEDTMSAGLTYNKDAKVYTDEAMTTELAAGNYTVNNNPSDGKTFTITFEQSYLDTITAATKLHVKYSAVLNKNAKVGTTGNLNESVLKYGDDSNTRSTPKSETITHTWEMKVYKYAQNESREKALAGAKFTLSKEANGSNPIALIDEGNNVYRVAKADEENTVTEITTDATGKFTIKGLDSDTYYLTETKEPDGYNKLTGPVVVRIGNDGKVEYKKADGSFEEVSEIRVLNKSGTELPSTGGVGTTIFYVLGGILAVGAAVLLVTKKRMEQA